MSAFNTNRLLAAAAAAAITAASFALPAYASEPNPVETRIAVVSTAGLDLNTQLGLTTLNARIRAAASSLCGAPVLDDPRQLATVRQCRAGAIASTAPQVQAAIETAAITTKANPAVKMSSIDR